MNFIKTAIKRPVAIFVVMAVVLILGIVSISKMEMALTPDVDLPVAIVMTEYKGAGPEEVESLVTEALEGAIANVENIDTISSTSSEGLSLVIAQFDYGIDLDKAVNSIRDKISMVEGALPEEAGSPTIMKVDMNAQAVANIVVSSETMSNDALKAFAEDTVQPRLERQKGVASVEVTGGNEQEIKIEIDPERLEGLGMTMAGIGQILVAENTDQAGGKVEYGDTSMTISSKLKMHSVDDVKMTPIKLPSGTVVQLQDIATITETNKEIDSISRYNGKPAINLAVTKASDGNTVTTVNAVKTEVDTIGKIYKDIRIEIVEESGSVIENSVKNVISNIFIGAILSIIVLFIFLKNVGLTGIIAVSMPLSIIGTFVLLYFSGTTLNMISLGGLSIGVGMLVDNSVVVIENIYRYRTSEGYDKIKGTYLGTKEVALAVAASTMTTVAVFVPFAFATGLVLQMMMDLALAVVFSLLMSLVVAVTVVPMLSGNYVNNIHRNHAPKRLDFVNKILDGFDHFIKRLDSLYRKGLTWVLKNKKKTLTVICVIFIGSLMLLPSIGMELMPSADEGTFTVKVEAPRGSKLEAVNALSAEVEGILESLPELHSMTVSMSDSTSGMNALRGGGAGESTIKVKLVDKKERKKSVDEVMEEVRTQTKAVAGATVTVTASSNMGSMGGSGGVTVEIYGDDLEIIQEIGEQLEAQITKVEGARQVKSSLEEQEKQVALKLDKDKIRQYNLTGSQVASQVKNIISGYTATTLKVDGTEMDIRIVYPEQFVTSVANLGDVGIGTGAGSYVPLSSIAKIEMADVPSSVERSDQSRYITVSADVFGRSTGEVGQDVETIISKMTFPEGYTVKMGGTNEMMEDTFSSLFQVIILAIVLVYLVMAAQFESLLDPFIIMFTIPVAFSGAIVLLFLSGESLSMMGLIGCLVLVGIVVNNGIILIDYINTLRGRDGYSLEEATLKACPTRLRPILMTAMTTILGQIPVILSNGANSETLKPMGLVIAGGLAASTFLTLFLVPTLYVYFDGAALKMRSRFKIKPKMTKYDIERELENIG